MSAWKELTAGELEKVQELRSRVSGELTSKFQHSDEFLITWLRARGMNLDPAEEMLRKSLAWRKEKNVDGIAERESLPDKYKNRLPFAYLGMQAETGCPVFLFLLGRYDFRAIVEDIGVEGALRFNIIFMELVQGIMKDCAKKVGHPVTSFIELMDLEGYTLRQVGTKESRDGIMQMQYMFDANYPEVMNTVIAINAPKVFYFVFNMMKPLMPKATLEKLDILGPDVEKWKAAISKKLPMELVPPHWGGTRDGNDEYCSSSDFWILGPLGPKYFSNEDPEGFVKAKVKPRDKVHLEFHVEEDNMHLEWQFRTEGHDISFALSNEHAGEIIPLKRVESHKNLQEGRHKCEKAGKYTIVFDNTYSYTRAKTVYHKIEVVTPHSPEQFVSEVSMEVSLETETNGSDILVENVIVPTSEILG